MTLVAVWLFDETQIHAVADTRISHDRGVATKHGPKILPIAVLCRRPSPLGFFSVEHFRAEFGFAYSGSTLSALAAHALANIVCSNLIGLEDFSTTEPRRYRKSGRKHLRTVHGRCLRAQR